MARSTSTEERLHKLENLMNNKGATEGERAAAKAAWERTAGRKYTSKDKAAYSARNSSSSSRSATSSSPYGSYASARQAARNQYAQAARDYYAQATAAAQAEYDRAVRDARRSALVNAGVDVGLAALAAGSLYGAMRYYINRSNRNARAGGRAASNAARV